MTDVQSLIQPWGWIVAAAFIGYAAGQAHCLFIVRKARPRACARCTYYLGWRDHLLSELKKRPPLGKPQDIWERESPH